LGLRRVGRHVVAGSTASEQQQACGKPRTAARRRPHRSALAHHVSLLTILTPLDATLSPFDSEPIQL